MKSNKPLEINEQELIKDITQIKKLRALNVEQTQIKYVIRPNKIETKKKKRTKKNHQQKRWIDILKKYPNTFKKYEEMILILKKYKTFRE